MSLRAGGSTQMFSLALFPTSVSLTYTDHCREEKKMTGGEAGGGREKKGRLEKNAEARQLSK